jgi:heptosyltransferase I
MKIAIVKLSALGDIVHAMIVLQFIIKFNNEILIDWYVEESYKELLESNPLINQVHSINIKKAKKNSSLLILYKELAKLRKIEPYDLVIDMQGLIKSAIISRIIPSNITLGFDKFSSREKISSIFYNKTFNYDYGANIVERNLAIIEFALGFYAGKNTIQDKLPILYPKALGLDFKLSNTQKNILIIPGASHSSKRYPTKKFAELTFLIDANFLVIWGSQDEKILAQDIKKKSQQVNICSKLKLDQLILLISKVDLVIGPDTGPTHISWALNVPSITLFGPTPGYRNSYSTQINKIIESDSIVNPNNIDKNDKSIKDIDTRKVAKVALDLLR